MVNSYHFGGTYCLGFKVTCQNTEVSIVIAARTSDLTWQSSIARLSSHPQIRHFHPEDGDSKLVSNIYIC
jgi:hypothetical protein